MPPPLRDDQAAARLAVEPVHEVEFGGLGTGGPEHLDHAVGHPAAAVHGDAGRLVEDQDVVVLVDDGPEHPLDERAARRAGARGRRFGLPHRRDPDPVARRDALVGPCALAVHAHLALAEQPVDVRPRDTLQVPDQEVVEPLAVVAFAGFDVANAARGRLACRGFALILVSH